MKTIKALLAGVIAAVATSASALTWTDDPAKAISTGTGEKTLTWVRSGSSYSLKYDTKGVTPGKWTSDFASAKEYADKYNIPMLVFVGSEECGYCNLMKSTGIVSSTFTSWVKNNPIVLVFVEYPSTSALSADMNSTLVQFVINSSGLLPLMRTYWKKADGSTAGSVFAGRQSKMPSREGSTCASQLVGTLNLHFGSWDGKLPSNEPDYAGGYFSITGNAAANRLEAVAGRTKTVKVPLYRTATSAATNRLQAGDAAQITVSWAAGAANTNQLVSVTIPDGLSAGDSIPLKLYDADGAKLVSSSSITIVNEPANSLTNPCWIGESFEAGEWTMDLDAALAKAKGSTAHTLVYASGELWCPYCASLESKLLSSAGFKKWAKDNNVNLVLLDNPRRSSDDVSADGAITKVGTRPNGAPPTLLRYAAGSNGKSGAAYLSRKSIEVGTATTKGTAEYVLQRNHDLLYKGGSLCSPETMRMPYPSVILANSDGTVAGVLRTAWDGTTYNLDVSESINRLDELLKLEGSNMKNSAPSTTTETLAVEGDGDGTVQVNANRVFYRLSNVPAGRVTFTAEGTDAKAGSASLALALYETSSTLADASILASGTNTVTATFSSGSNKYLAVTGHVDPSASYGIRTEVSFSLSSVVTLVPSQTLAKFTTKSGNLNMTVVSGTRYKFSGFSSYADFTANSDGTYTAKKSGTVAMSAGAGATVTYQTWVPGTVAFESASAKKMEADGSGTVSVKRSGGGSGAATVAVSVDRGSAGTKRVTVTPATLSWKDGETGSKTVTYRIAADAAFNPDETFSIALAVSSGSAALGSPSSFKLTVTDSDDPVLASDTYSLMAYRGMAMSARYPVSNIKENGRVTIDRDGSLPAGVKLSYVAASKSLVLSGTPKRAGRYTFGVKLSEARSDGRATGNRTAFTVTVVDMASLKPGDAGYNAAFVSGGTVQGAIPLYGKSGGKSILAGVLELKILRTFKVTAKFTGADGSKATMRGSVSAVNSSGNIDLALSSGAASARISIASSGLATASVAGVARAYGSTLSSSSAGVRLGGSAYSAYRGYYVVSLPVDAEASSLVKGGETLSTGTGYITLKMNLATFAKSGKVTYKGMLANGKAFSGSTILIPNCLTKDGYTWGYVPVILANKAGNNASFILRVRRGAASDYADDPRVVFASDDAKPVWSSGGRTYFLNAYGNYYDTAGETLVECCDKYYEKTTFEAVFDTQYLASGTIKTLPKANATVNPNSTITIQNLNAANLLRLKVANKTGIATGTAQITFSNGRSVRGKVAGVILVGWADCDCGISQGTPIDRPVFSGSVYYSEGTATRGFLLDLK